MTKDQLIAELNFIDRSRFKRDAFASYFFTNKSELPILMKVVFDIDSEYSIKATWVLECLCTQDLHCLIPYLEEMSKKVRAVHFDSAKRPFAKIIEMLAMAYYTKGDSIIKNQLKPILKKRFIEFCFDCMIHQEKVAVKVFCMNSLYLFGREFSWIHPELKIILEQDFTKQSAAFKARARHLLKKLTVS